MRSLYFAYGSNMSSARLRARIPDARALGAAWLDGHRVLCNKVGRDGSGKANLLADGVSIAWGVLFELPRASWSELDRFEWGYARRRCEVRLDEGAASAQLYLAEAPGPVGVPPFDWYRDHCLEGALEHGLPEKVVVAIRTWHIRRGPEG